MEVLVDTKDLAKSQEIIERQRQVIIDLREKCDKLAGAVELIQYLDNIAGGTFRMCMSDDTEARWEAIVQIAREVRHD